MSKFDKFKEIFNIAAPIAGVAFPPSASILSGVKNAIDSHSTKPSQASQDALAAIAKDNDEQTQAILSLFEYAKKLEARISKLEN